MSYDHIGLCATLEDQISYKEDLYVYPNEKCSISVIADRAFDVWDIKQLQVYIFQGAVQMHTSDTFLLLLSRERYLSLTYFIHDYFPLQDFQAICGT